MKNTRCLLLLIGALILYALVLFSCKTSKEQQIQIYTEIQEKADEIGFKETLRILDERIKKRDRGYYYYLYRGSLLFSQDVQKYSSVALRDFLKAHKIEPKRYEINHMIGDAYITIGEHEQAIPYLEMAYKLCPPEDGLPLPYWSLAEAYLHVGRFQDALEMNAQAIEAEDMASQYLQRGIILSHLGDAEALVDNFEIAARMEPKDSELRMTYSLRLIEMGYTGEAYQLYTQWLKGSESTNNWSYAGMGYILMLNGAWEKSLEMLKKAEAIESDWFVTNQYLSFYYFFTGDYEKAYEYEALDRASFEPEDTVPRRKSIDEYLAGYKKNWQFQRLLEKYGTGR